MIAETFLYPILKPKCQVVDNYGNHCPNLPVHFNCLGEQIQLCDPCYDRYMYEKQRNVEILENIKSIKGSANFNTAQQRHGGQSVSQPAPNCLTATSPC